MIGLSQSLEDGLRAAMRDEIARISQKVRGEAAIDFERQLSEAMAKVAVRLESWVTMETIGTTLKITIERRKED